MYDSFWYTQDWVQHRSIFWKVHLRNFCGQPNLRFLEIGSFEGRSAIWMLQNILTHETAKIDCVDVFYKDPDNYELRFDHNILHSGFSEKVTKLCGESKEVLRTLPLLSYDCIYIDGSHTAVDVIQDAVLSFLLLKPAGVLIFDDYAWDGDEDRPRKAIEAFLDIYRGKYVLLQKNYQVIIKK